MAYSEATIRARIKTVMESVTDIGEVHDYERWADDWGALLTLFKSTVDTVDQLRGWTITCRGMQQEIIGFQGGGITDTILVTYQYLVRGFMAVDDSEATEKTMMALVLSACTALEADATLQGKDLERDTPVVAAVRVDYRMFAGVLCHYAEIELQPQEVV